MITWTLGPLSTSLDPPSLKWRMNLRTRKLASLEQKTHPGDHSRASNNPVYRTNNILTSCKMGIYAIKLRTVLGKTTGVKISPTISIACRWYGWTLERTTDGCFPYLLKSPACKMTIYFLASRSILPPYDLRLSISILTSNIPDPASSTHQPISRQPSSENLRRLRGLVRLFVSLHRKPDARQLLKLNAMIFRWKFDRIPISSKLFAYQLYFVWRWTSARYIYKGRLIWRRHQRAPIQQPYWTQM